jgi:hypothetical protein
VSDKEPGVDFPGGGDLAPGGGHVWGQGEGPLALVTGLVVGVLSRDRQWAVEMPQGYAPEFELTMRDGRRFRVRLEEVPPTKQ